MEPLAIDLYCGLGGWTEGLLAEGYRVVGFDSHQHVYGEARYPAQLVIQDVLTLHGSQFKDAALIVASPPCQAYSYRAMPWKRAKALPPPDNSLFKACFRIQREAIEATQRTCRNCGGEAVTRGGCRCESCDGRGWTERYIPLVVENVCGAQKWVGRARWHYGSFYLWGDVPALMPITRKHIKVPMAIWYPPDHPKHVRGLSFNGHADRNLREGTKNDGGSWFAVAHNTTSGHSRNPDGRPNNARDRVVEDNIANAAEGCKQRGSGAAWWRGEVGSKSSKSSARKAASAHIAKIPTELARHIARSWKYSAVA